MGPGDNAISFFLVHPKYNSLLDLLRELRTELEIAVPRKEVRLPEVPTEDDIRRFYQAVWNCRNGWPDMVLIKTLFYTGVRVSELVSIRLDEVDVERCQIGIPTFLPVRRFNGARVKMLGSQSKEFFLLCRGMLLRTALLSNVFDPLGSLYRSSIDPGENQVTGVNWYHDSGDRG
jgi:integrase